MLCMSDLQPPVEEIVETSLRSLWDVVNQLARLRPPGGDEYRVTIFGSARTRPGDPVYQHVRDLARELATRGCTIVTGGGPGLMQAANEGAQLGAPDNPRNSIGIRVELPFEQSANPFVEQAYTHRTFFSRLHHFARLSNAFVVVDGGIGTTLESLMIWQLLQVRHLENVPLVFVGPMWRGLVTWAREHMLKPTPPLANCADLDIPTCVDSVAEALAILERSLAAHRSARPAAAHLAAR
ncbi:MAG: LOG family protein [Deltaproteobacteria bacterium]|nr:LOG family protein [Deltaproteobacteria bacterium]